jgi:hypothetical protein
MGKQLTWKVRMVVVAVVAAAAIGISSLGSTPSASAAPMSCENARKLAQAARNHALLFTNVIDSPYLARYWSQQAVMWEANYCRQGLP